MGGCRHHHQQTTCDHQERNTGGRSLRNRRYRRVIDEGDNSGQQVAKRLFTPQIKRFLKGWLVRRRNNPYPNRTEKKELAFKTGLTYIQICNWFANWRRKLKNSSRSTDESWGHLIKDYNNKAKGNVEQFSISSDDSIWDETAFNIDCENNSTIAHDPLKETDNCYYSNNNNNINDNISGSSDSGGKRRNTNRQRTAREEDTDKELEEEENWDCGATPKRQTSAPELLSKWLESAATYTANNRRYVPWGAYNVTWQTAGGMARRKLREVNDEDTDEEEEEKDDNRRRKGGPGSGADGQKGRSEGPRLHGGRWLGLRHREELDAAEALAHLSASCLHQEPTLQCH